MMGDKMALLFRRKNIGADTFTSRLLAVLEKALNSERETHIEHLRQKIDSLSDERDQLRQELADERRQFAQESTIIDTDHATLQRKYEDLEVHYKSLGWRKDQKELLYQSELQQRDRTIRLLRTGLRACPCANAGLSQELRALRQTFIHFSKRQLRDIQSVKSALASQFDHSISRAIRKQKKHSARQLAVLQTEFRQERISHDQLRGASQLLLDYVWTLSPRRKQVPKVALEDVPRRIGEVQAHIQKSIADHRELAVQEVRTELMNSLPEVGAPEKTLTEAIVSTFSERLAQKEDEC
jgi:hypothetical protein